MTGTDHHLTGLGQLAEFTRNSPSHRGKPGHEGYLTQNVVTLPELLKESGYFTLMAGKWHLGLKPEYSPKWRGFEKSFTLLPGCANHYGWEPQLDNPDDLPRFFETAVTALHMEGDQYVSKLPEDFYSSDCYADKMIEYFDSRTPEEQQKPWFAYLPFSAPHWPLQAPDENIEPYKSIYNDGPEALRQRRLAALKRLGLAAPEIEPHPVVANESTEWENLDDEAKAKSARAMEAYAGMVDRMDWDIGRVLEYLKARGEMENTYVIFMSDNGAEGASYEALPVVGAQVIDHLHKYYDNSIENIGRYNSFVWYGSRWAQAATAPSRLYKMYSTEGGIRVPFILYHSSFAGGEKVSDSFCTVMDIVPTFLDLARVTHPGTLYKGRKIERLRGKSWRSFLSTSTRTRRTQIHDNDYVTGWELAGTCAIRKGPWKICWVTRPKGPEKWELFNVEKDPGEVHDLAEENPEKLAELLAHWEEYVVETGTVGRSCDWGTMVVPVDEFEDDQKWIRYMAKQKGVPPKVNGVHHENGVNLANGHVGEFL